MDYYGLAPLLCKAKEFHQLCLHSGFEKLYWHNSTLKNNEWLVFRQKDYCVSKLVTLFKIVKRSNFTNFFGSWSLATLFLMRHVAQEIMNGWFSIKKIIVTLTKIVKRSNFTNFVWFLALSNLVFNEARCLGDTTTDHKSLMA